MADAKTPALIKLGPFKSVDYTTAGPDLPPGVGAAASNVDTQRQPGAMASARGRLNVVALTGGGTIGTLAQINRVTGSRQIVASINGGANQVVLYNPDTATQITSAGGANFSQAVQFGNVLFTNTNSQIRPGSSFNSYPWTFAFLGPTIALTPAPAGNLAPATYYYAMTTVVTFPDGATQESTPSPGANPPYANNVAAVTALPAGNVITLSITSGSFSGTLANGATWTTNIYRQSTNQPTWYLAGNATGAAFNDNSSDPTIAANQQLLFRSQLPLGFMTIATPPVIFRHQDRMWAFFDIDDAALTLSQTQCQLWFSDPGTPWSFYADTQALLVGNESDNATLGPITQFNDAPMAGVSLSSVGILHKRRATYILYGNDPATYIPLKMWDLGCVSGASATVCEDVDAWLSEEGPHITDGSTKQYIGEPMRTLLETIPTTDWVNSVGFFANRTWHLSFPATGITMRYYFPKNEWLPPLPYATNTAYSVIAENSPVGLRRFNEMIAARNSGTFIDSWAVADGQDLGAPIVSTWTSGLTDSGECGFEKSYQWCVVNAPVQPGYVLQVVTTVQNLGVTRTATSTFDLGLGPTLTATIGDANGGITGFMGQVTATLTAPAGATAPGFVYEVSVYGSVVREMVASAVGVS